MLISIIILTHNQWELTERCLESLRRHTPEEHEIIVVDNGSTDGTPTFLEAFPEVKLLRNAENLGFAKGCNQGYNLASGDAVLFLNNDTIVTENWLRNMLRVLNSGEKIGLVGPVTNFCSGSQQIPAGYLELSGLDAFAVDHAQRHAGLSRKTNRLVGFCLLAKRQVLEEIGLFDERYGLGMYEDDDLCLRAVSQGYELRIALDSFVHHTGHATFREIGADMGQLLQENKRKAMEKWGSDIHELMRQKNTAQGPITISLCMIVKNEEQTLARCLNSVRDAVDEIVIVDTGSTDRTKEIAGRFTERVLDFEWTCDFAAARNYAFDQATMEYILWLDADDVLLPTEREKLIALKQSFDRSLDAVSMIYHCAFDDSGQVSLSVRRFRLVRREKGMRWVGAVHEDLEVSGNIMDTDIVVTHRKEEARTDRNLRIFEGLVARGVSLTKRDLFHYARELHVNGKYEQAVKVYRDFLEHDGLSAEDHIFVCGALADCYHQLGDTSQELEWAFRSFRFDVPRPQFCCRIGYHFLQRNELHKAIYWYQRAAESPPPTSPWAIDNVPSRTWLPHMQLAFCYFRLGNYAMSYRHNELALAHRPGDEQILSNMALCRELMQSHSTPAASMQVNMA